MSLDKRKGTPLKGFLDYRVAPDLTSEAIGKYLQALDCPRSLAVWMLFREGEHRQLIDLDCRPDDYDTPFDFRAAYAATEFLSKYKRLSLDYDLDQVAMLKFNEFEQKCKQTNTHFRNLAYHPSYRGDTVRLHNAVVRKIAKILGEVDVEEFFQLADWGPGATTRILARDACSANKFQYETGITRRLYDLVAGSYDFFGDYYPKWSKALRAQGFPCFVPGNKVTTVPKNAKTNRVIAIEPGLNLWFQKAVGATIRKRLLRSGNDLRFQSKNQQLAYLGSIEHKLATIDFSSASDSISTNVVRELIPPLWFELMDACRSHYQVSADHSLTKWNKFSSMGNGFTFELESLIFYATALVCTEDSLGDESRVSVYGDDVILPVDSVELFRTMSEFYGFTFNATKSFYSGCFRESCGKHYHSGIDVTPFYLKDRLSTIQTVYRYANSVRRLAHRWDVLQGCNAVFAPVFYLLVKSVPKALRLMIPATLGDGGFIANYDEACPNRARHGHCGYDVLNLVEASLPRGFDGEGLLRARLWLRRQSTDFIVVGTDPLTIVGPPDEPPIGTGNNVSTRGNSTGKLTRSRVWQWYNLGPWL